MTPLPKRIFIVEDESLVAANLKTRLVMMGYEVAGQAASGEDALERIAQTRPDLVLMDIILRGQLDGIQTAAQLQKTEPAPIIIFLTAHADESTAHRAAETAPFGYVLKPFDERELKVALEVGIYRHQTEQRLRDMNVELQSALKRIKTLHGLLPICAWCKKIRDDEGYWQSLEFYLKTHTDAELTHSICPSCLAREEAEIDVMPGGGSGQ